MKLHLLLTICSLLVFGVITQFSVLPDSHPDTAGGERQKGVCWVGGRTIVTQKEFQPLIKNKINWISQTPFGWQPNVDMPEIKINSNSDRTWWGESDQGIIETTRLACQNNIRTLLKPHLWVRGSWPGDIQMNSEPDWKEWFINYKAFILRYARLAEEAQIEILCIGTELNHTVSFESEWRDIILEIRKIYSGKLTYAANFHEEFQKIKFWDDLDFIGVQAYFPLSKNKNPPLDELAASWSQHLQSIEAIHKSFNKPVLFTEIGYRSTDDAAVEPWKWPQDNLLATSSESTQAVCYKAFFEAAWKKDWLMGVYFWKWYPHGGQSMHSIDFTPQGKAAEKILSQYFNH